MHRGVEITDEQRHPVRGLSVEEGDLSKHRPQLEGLMIALVLLAVGHWKTTVGFLPLLEDFRRR